ncbi:MAG: methylmalonyl-CoA mutase, partial [Tissierellia bacterium]|nr:methylmalonyl-CoA mutase [Tissierellia bacterium]
NLGGATKAIEKGFIQKEIQNSAYKYQMQVESLDQIVVGVNKFQVEETQKRDLLRVDPHVEILQRKKLQKLRETRDKEAVNKALETLKAKAETDENLMPYIIDAVKVYATLGEICDELREVFGEYEQTVIL